MSKQQGDFITYVRNGAAINALVAFSRDVYTPATQTVPASTVEHLTLVYLDPSAASSGIQTGEQLRSSVKTEFSVPPLTEGKVNGWKDLIEPSAGGINLEYATDHIWTMEDKPGFIGLRVDCGDAGTIYFTPDQAEQTIDALKFQMFHLKSSGIDGDAGDWTQAGMDKDGFPIAKGSAEDVSTPSIMVEGTGPAYEPGVSMSIHDDVTKLSGRDANGVPIIVGLGDGTITRDGTFVPAELTDAEKDELADKATADLPETVTPEAMAAQDEHDHATGNVDEEGRTPNEAIEQENAQKPSVGIGQPAQ